MDRGMHRQRATTTGDCRPVYRYSVLPSSSLPPSKCPPWMSLFDKLSCSTADRPLPAAALRLLPSSSHMPSCLREEASSKNQGSAHAPGALPRLSLIRQFHPAPYHRHAVARNRAGVSHQPPSATVKDLRSSRRSPIHHLTDPELSSRAHGSCASPKKDYRFQAWGLGNRSVDPYCS